MIREVFEKKLAEYHASRRNILAKLEDENTPIDDIQFLYVDLSRIDSMMEAMARELEFYGVAKNAALKKAYDDSLEL